MFARHLTPKALGTLAIALALSQAAQAGPPLICHPLSIAEGALLPWNDGPGWFAPDPGYDVGRLTEDTLRLLSDDAPVLARMENLRRASIYAYASEDPGVANELLAAVLERKQKAAKNATAAALARFDAGYLIEAYRQAGLVVEWGMPGPLRRSTATALAGKLDSLDGYRLVQQAMKLAPNVRAEMEFAASLMTRDSGAATRHRERAAEGAKPGSTLAANLAR